MDQVELRKMRLSNRLGDSVRSLCFVSAIVEIMRGERGVGTVVVFVFILIILFCWFFICYCFFISFSFHFVCFLFFFRLF